MKKIVILGAGISGLVLYYILRKEEDIIPLIIDKKAGIDPDAKYITFFTKSELPFSGDKRTLKVSLRSEKSSPEEIIKDYTRKCYGKECVPNTSLAKYFESTSISGVGQLRILRYEEIYPIDYDKLFPFPSSDLISEQAVAVDIFKREIILLSGKRVAFDFLLNTIPLNIFCKMSIPQFDFAPDYRKIKIEVKKVSKKKEDLWEMIYVPSETEPFYRIFENDTVRIEETILKLGEEEKLKQRIISPGKILADERSNAIKKYFQMRNVFMFGRYAEWIPKRMVEEVYRNFKIFVNKNFYKLHIMRKE